MNFKITFKNVFPLQAIWNNKCVKCHNMSTNNDIIMMNRIIKQTGCVFLEQTRNNFKSLI